MRLSGVGRRVAMACAVTLLAWGVGALPANAADAAAERADDAPALVQIGFSKSSGARLNPGPSERHGGAETVKVDASVLPAAPGDDEPQSRASSIWYPQIPQYGNPTGGASISAAGVPVDTPATPKVVGTGTAGSCTSAALQSALFGGGHVTFNCGSSPVTITVSSTLYLCNTHNCAHPWQGGTSVNSLVVDGGGLVTLSGGGNRGIFYANTCEEEFGWRDASCQNDTTPVVVFQNIAFSGGNATSIQTGWEGPGGGGGGGAIAMRGGQLKVYNSHFSGNRCVTAHSDAGGGAIRLTGQEATSYVVNSTIESNQCANGGGVSVLHAPLTVLNSVISGNTATGTGASSGNGGNGGAVYSDGTWKEVLIDGSILSGNVAPEGGPGVFYVSNDRAGHLSIRNSQIINNTGQRFYTSPYRDIFYLGRQSLPTVTNSTVE